MSEIVPGTWLRARSTYVLRLDADPGQVIAKFIEKVVTPDQILVCIALISIPRAHVDCHDCLVMTLDGETGWITSNLVELVL